MRSLLSRLRSGAQRVGAGLRNAFGRGGSGGGATSRRAASPAAAGSDDS